MISISLFIFPSFFWLAGIILKYHLTESLESGVEDKTTDKEEENMTMDQENVSKMMDDEDENTTMDEENMMDEGHSLPSVKMTEEDMKNPEILLKLFQNALRKAKEEKKENEKALRKLEEEMVTALRKLKEEKATR